MNKRSLDDYLQAAVVVGEQADPPRSRHGLGAHHAVLAAGVPHLDGDGLRHGCPSCCSFPDRRAYDGLACLGSALSLGLAQWIGWIRKQRPSRAAGRQHRSCTPYPIHDKHIAPLQKKHSSAASEQLIKQVCSRQLLIPNHTSHDEMRDQNKKQNNRKQQAADI